MFVYLVTGQIANMQTREWCCYGGKNLQLGRWRCFLTCHRGGSIGGDGEYRSVSRLWLSFNWKQVDVAASK